MDFWFPGLEDESLSSPVKNRKNEGLLKGQDWGREKMPLVFRGVICVLVILGLGAFMCHHPNRRCQLFVFLLVCPSQWPIWLPVLHPVWWIRSLAVRSALPKIAAGLCHSGFSPRAASVPLVWIQMKEAQNSWGELWNMAEFTSRH